MSIYMMYKSEEEAFAFRAKDDDDAERLAQAWGHYHKMRKSEYRWEYIGQDNPQLELPSDDWFPALFA